MITYEHREFSDLFRMMLPLLPLHYDEVALNKDLMVLSPDKDLYARMQDAGNLHCIGMFDNGTLVGYSLTFVVNHPHYSGLIVGQNDLLFVLQDYRLSGAGRKLVEETETQVAALGAKLMLWHAKKDTALDTMLSKSYAVQDIIYSKELAAHGD
jgi:GNAT superfamily N-acetyltransferase